MQSGECAYFKRQSIARAHPSLEARTAKRFENQPNSASDPENHGFHSCEDGKSTWRVFFARFGLRGPAHRIFRSGPRAARKQPASRPLSFSRPRKRSPQGARKEPDFSTKPLCTFFCLPCFFCPQTARGTACKFSFCSKTCKPVVHFLWLPNKNKCIVFCRSPPTP